MAKLIGLVGYRGAGKSTVTEYALKLLPPIIQQHNFSTPLYAMLEAMGIPREIVRDKKRWNEPLDILCGHSTRYAATTLGTEWGRDQIGKDVWANVAINRATQANEQGIHVIIDNVRFPNEFLKLETLGATLIAFRRPDMQADRTHESEHYIEMLQDRCDLDFDNITDDFGASSLRFTKMLTGICFES